MAGQRRGRPEDEKLKQYEDNVAGLTGLQGLLRKWLRFISFFADHDNLPVYKREHDQSQEFLERMKQQQLDEMEAYKKSKRKK